MMVPNDWIEEYEEQERNVGGGLSRFTGDWTKFCQKIKNKLVFQRARKLQHSMDAKAEAECKREFQEALDDARKVAASNTHWSRWAKRALKRLAPKNK